MKAYLFNIISAYVYTLGSLIEEQKTHFNKESHFVFQQLKNMPWYFSFAFSLLTILSVWVLSQNGVPFHRLDSATRKRKLKLLEKTKLSICRDFFKFFNNLTVFAYYSYKEENA